MSDRLHEIIAQVAMIHKDLQENQKINNANLVIEEIKTYSKDIQEHYLNLLLQYYFQENDLVNFKILLLKNAKFQMRMDDIKCAFLNIKSNNNNVIEFMEDSIMYLKDIITNESLEAIYNYYKNNKDLQIYLEESIEIIKRNRYVCAYCFKHKSSEYSSFFINDELLEVIKKDLPYLLK